MIEKFKEKLLFAVWTCKNKQYGIYQMMDEPLRELFENIVTFDPQEIIYKYGKEEMNKRFLEVIKQERPDIVFLQLIQHEFFIDTLIKIKQILPNAKIVNYSGDDDILFYNYNIYFFPIIDYFFITQPNYLPLYKKFGKKAFLILGSNSKKFKPLNIKKEYDVTFVGSVKQDRYEYIKYLIQKNINIKVYGNGWEKYKDLKNIYKGVIDDKDFVKTINQSKINLIFSKNLMGKTHVLDRLPQINMCNGFALVEYCNGYNQLFKKGKNIAFFKDKKELFNKINYYLKNNKERKEIAKNAYEKTIKRFNITYLFKEAFKNIIINNNLNNEILNNRKEKIIILKENDLKLDNKIIIKKIKNYNYIAFRDKNCEFSPYKEYFQIYGLKKTNKKISCCDYYIYSKLIGKYLSSGLVFADKRYINENINLFQIIIKKEYFLNNLNKFKRFHYKQHTDELLLDTKKMAIVALPLVQINDKNSFDPKIENTKYYVFDFIIPFLNILYDKKAIFNIKPYKIILYGLIYKPWILKYIFIEFFNKYKKRYKLKKLKNNIF